MKRILFVVVLVVMAVGLFAQITPYGSARIGYWYENRDKDMLGGDDSRLSLNYGLQSNSRFGVNFKHDNLIGKVEYGTGVNLRLLYAKQSFGSWSLLIGQDNDGTNQYANQVWGTDNGLIGYGAVDGGRNPQIKMEMDNGFYAALIRPNTSYDPANQSYAIDALIPKINLGYNMKMDDLKIMPTFMMQMYNYNKDFSANENDASVLSWLFAATAEYNAEPMLVKAHLNYGSNTGNMGYAGPSNLAVWDSAKKETIDTATLGGFLMFGYDVSPTMNINTGVGFASSSNDKFEEDDARMAFYIQANMRLQKLRIVPEIGMINHMDDIDGESEGSMLYFGTQLRFDF